MENTGRILDGSAFSEKTIKVYTASVTNTIENTNTNTIDISVIENKEKEQSILITIDKYPMMKLRGSLPDNNGNFFLTSLDYLAGSTHGWNEFTLQLAGRGSFSFEETFSFEEKTYLKGIFEIEPIQVSDGRIHQYDTRITGNNALSALRNRYERIEALVDWMLLSSIDNLSIKDFEKHWKPVLFPELVSRQIRPDLWHHDGDKYERSDSINWNTSYTARTFPEELHVIRNSGTLLRDWEEALPWIYLFYEWNNIQNLFSSQIILTMIK